jgi:hypothetical protein
MPVTPELERLSQENCKLEASLGYTVRPHPNFTALASGEPLIEKEVLYVLEVDLGSIIY